jgi:anaerobic selenocysteine-containing dehydrogenase
MADTAPDSTATNTTCTVCPYCGVGCGLKVELEGGRVARVRGDATHRGTHGMLCRKAVYLPQAVNAPDRLAQPQMRLGRDQPWQTASWDAALGLAAESLRRIVARHGPESIAFYISGQLLTEDYYVINKLAKGFLGTNNVDSNSRLCMASAASAYQLAFGSDGPPCAYDDFDVADCFLFIGSNAADTHPVLFQRALRRKAADPHNVTVLVVDPRRTATARAADVHIQLRPGTDVPLLQGLLHVLIRDGLVQDEFIREHTSGWDAVGADAAAWTPDRAAATCGISPELIVDVARRFGKASGVLSCWAMGLNQAVDGVDRSLALVNLHLSTGQIGRPGAGPFSLTGQPNAMGGREVGGLAGLLPGYRSVMNPTHRRELADLWGVPAERIGSRPGRTGVEMFEGLASGDVKAVWIAATNPMVSMPDLSVVRRGLERAELVVVQDAYFPTETTDLADIVLPAAQWSEKEGVATSSERRISYLPALVAPPGNARPDWAIFADLAQRLGFSDAFAYTKAEAVFVEYRRTTAGTPVDITGISYARLQRAGGIQWPCSDEAGDGASRLYADGRFATDDGRARFHVPTWRQPTNSAPYLVTLMTGRERDQWHTMTRTRHVPQLLKSCPTPYVAVHPSDAARLGFVEDDQAELRVVGRGESRYAVRITDEVLPGTVFVPFHWGALRHEGGPVNTLLETAVDPRSKQPSLKSQPVQLRRAA